MQLDQTKVALVLDQFFWPAQATTSLTIAELAAPIHAGDVLTDRNDNTRYDVSNVGFRPKRGGLAGVLRSELSREASITITGKTKRKLTGRFLISLHNALLQWQMKVRLDQVHLERLQAPGGLDASGVLVGTPLVVRHYDASRAPDGIGVLVPTRSMAGTLSGDLRLFAKSPLAAPEGRIALHLGSTALANGPILDCTVTDAIIAEDLISEPVTWQEES